jgi:ribosome-associated heat shock protein Hsp15
MTPANLVKTEPDAASTTGQRIDKWLWFARAARTRTLVATLVTEGKVRVNGVKIDKSAHTLRIGDTVAVVMRQKVSILRVKGFAERRGSATLAALLFDDLTVKPEPTGETGTAARPLKDGSREPGSGRPTKRDRRKIDGFKSNSG